MDKLYLDFKNKIIGFDNEVQRGTEMYVELCNKMLDSCIDSEVLKHDCITLDFETEEIIINNDIDYRPERGEIICIDSFKPVQSREYHGLAKKKKDIWEALDITVVDISIDIALINLLMNI